MKTVAFDLETHLIQNGLLAPPVVCGSIATPGQPAEILTADGALTWFRENVGRVRIVGANISYDNGCMAATDSTLLPAIFEAYDRDMFGDVLIQEMLNHIGHGWVLKHCLWDPKTNKPLLDPSKNKKANRMSLATVLYLTTGLKDAKKNDKWRLSYARLANTPIAGWPADAVQYPKDDVVNTLTCDDVQRGHMNQHNAPDQIRAAWALQLASMWGLRTNPERVEVISARVDASIASAMVEATQEGLRRPDGSEDGQALGRRVARAYGDSAVCPVCAGTGKVTSAKSGRPINCKACSGSGIAVVNTPKTDKGGIKTDRDTLEESGDEVLERYAQVSKDEKFRDTYLPYLRRATRVPLNPQGNVLLNSGRTSYDGLIQLIPRGGGLRECFEPRAGSVFFSVDYTGLELCALAQVTTWIVGWSKMADAINSGLDLHTKFAASMVGTSYTEMLAAVKRGESKAKNARYAAKAANFGFPGGMGTPKLVAAKRKEGLRFCIALDQAPKCDCDSSPKCRQCRGRGAVCGTQMITEWNGRPCPPVCLRCTELAHDLREAWFLEWPEIKSYFKFISRTVDGSGELTQFISKRVRGGLDFCSGANTLFQGLGADGAKRALWLASREMYTDRNSKMFGSRISVFVHDELFGEVGEAQAPEAAERLCEVMIAGMGEYIPDVKITVEPALMRYWAKDAACVRDVNGRLQVWEPKK